MLVSDDFNLRKLAKDEFGIEGIWIQPLLMYSADMRHLNQAAYNRAVTSLAAWRHEFTSINVEQLLSAATRGHWKVTAEFEALVFTLALSRAELQSNLKVCFMFLRELWR